MTPERWPQVEEIFEAALEPAPEERGGLDKACNCHLWRNERMN